MMAGNCPSPLFAHRRSLSEPLLQKLVDSTKTISTATTPSNPKGEGGQSCPFRRALSQTHLLPPRTSSNDTHQRMRKWRCSRKNGLLLAADELAMVAVHDKGADPLNSESKANGNSIFVRHVQSEGVWTLRPTEKEDKKQSMGIKSKLLDRSSSSTVAESEYSLEVGAKGVVLMCSERGCSPAHPSHAEHASIGKESNIISSNEGSRGADRERRDAYYEKMLESNPGNPLLLTNYSKFLHEVQHDVEKAEKCYKEALMASSGDGEILSMYANFIWETHNDAAQAELYFRQAVEVASENCYVVASYAYFLWNSKDDDEEEKLL